MKILLWQWRVTIPRSSNAFAQPSYCYRAEAPAALFPLRLLPSTCFHCPVPGASPPVLSHDIPFSVISRLRPSRSSVRLSG